MAVDINELLQERGKVWEEMKKLQDDIDSRGQETGEETEKMAKFQSAISGLTRRIDRENELRAIEADMAKKADAADHKNGIGHERFDGIRYGYPMVGRKAPSREEINTRAAFAVQGWLLAGKAENVEKITDEHRAAAKFFGFDLTTPEIVLPLPKDYRHIKKEYRDLSVGSNSDTVAEGFVPSLEVSLLQYGGVRQVATVRRTATGADLPWPTMTDVSNKGAILAEATTFSTSVDPTFGQVIFKAFKYSSKPIIISNELLQDSAFDLATEIGSSLGIRIGRIQNDHFTTGAGTTLPKGVVVCSGEGKEAASQTAITADEIIDLQHSLDPAYRPNAMFMMHDTIVGYVRKLKFSIGSDAVSYAWQPSMQAGVPDRLLGYPYVVNQSMSAALTIGEKIMLFGDFSKYVVRDVAEVRLVRLNELFAQTDQVGFIAFLRSDGQLLDAGTDPVKHLTTKKS